MRNIPFSASLSAQLAADFPGLKYSFFCEELAGALVLVDAITGNQLQGPGASVLTKNADGTLTFTADFTYLFDPEANAAVPFEAPGTRNVILMTCGKPSTSGQPFILGPTGTGVDSLRTPNVSGTGAGRVLQVSPAVDQSTGTIAVAGTGSQLQSRFASFQWGSATGLNAGIYNGTSWTDATPGNLSTVASYDTPINNCVVDDVAKPAFLLAWYLTKMPTIADIKTAMLWMDAQVRNGGTIVKRPYPGWKGWA